MDAILQIIFKHSATLKKFKMKPSRIEGVAEEEFLQCLGKFTEAGYFAAIKAGGKCINEYLVAALNTLYKLNLLPVVVHGGGDQIDKNLEKAGIGSVKIDGKRVTNKETLDVVVNTLKGINQELVKSVNDRGAYARGLNGIFYAHGTDPVYGNVGKVIGTDVRAVDVCLSARAIPIISCLGRYGPQYSNINGDTAFAHLVSKIRPMKVIMLTPTGGVYREDKLISELGYDELNSLLESEFVNGGMKQKLRDAKNLVENGFDVQITSPEKLLIELFSRKGHGTYLHKAE